MLHGLLAAAGATLLLYAAVTVSIPVVAEVGLAFLVITAIGGVVLNLKYQSFGAMESLPESRRFG